MFSFRAIFAYGPFSDSCPINKNLNVDAVVFALWWNNMHYYTSIYFSTQTVHRFTTFSDWISPWERIYTHCTSGNIPVLSLKYPQSPWQHYCFLIPCRRQRDIVLSLSLSVRTKFVRLDPYLKRFWRIKTKLDTYEQFHMGLLLQVLY